MRGIITIIALLVVGIVPLAAQQTPQYTLYMLNKFGINPAYAGLDQSLSVTGVYREQWVDLPGSPVTQHFNLHLPSYFLGGGLGLEVENERLGAEEHFAASLSYANHLILRNRNIISIGVSGGIVQKALDGSLLRTPDGVYEGPTINHNDDLLPDGRLSATGATFGAGIYFQGESFETGLSVDHIAESSTAFSLFDYKLRRTFSYFATYGFDVGRKFRFSPSVLVKSIIEQTQMDFSALVQYNDNLFAGVTFRGYSAPSIDALAIFGGFKINEKFTVAYGYDITLSSLSDVSRGSHEVLLNYNLGKPLNKGKLPPIIYNPRFR
ncbi:MAG: PorP/SprF family type IX secretion system membrane protein [Phaeodactylibacter sp.]|nr:PorP/SprF family type IX secretion system membrane protein [Phaeodactylibacter sp.]